MGDPHLHSASPSSATAAAIVCVYACACALALWLGLLLLFFIRRCAKDHACQLGASSLAVENAQAGMVVCLREASHGGNGAASVNVMAPPRNGCQRAILATLAQGDSVEVPFGGILSLLVFLGLTAALPKRVAAPARSEDSQTLAGGGG